jgi:threonine synthase
MTTLYLHLECTSCKKIFDKNILQSYCKECLQPLVAIYDLDKHVTKDIIIQGDRSMWRYKKVLPIVEEKNIVSLGEGGTPIAELKAISRDLDLRHPLLMKDEGLNPTGSFKARGMSVAISKAKEFNVRKCCTPTAGNAGSAMAAYCAKAGIDAKIYMPVLTPKMFSYDTSLMGAEVVKVEGSIRDAGLLMQKDNANYSMWDLSTMKEPFRLEGKKTLGYEIAEQLNWSLPDVIFYPTGGGTGLIGIWKAFNEMLTMGWLTHIPTRMIAVQGQGCDPIVKAFEGQKGVSMVCENPLPTAANGLRVPKAFADKMILDVIYKSNGCAIRVAEADILLEIKNVAQKEGVFISPEGAALFCALKLARASGQVTANDKIMLLNTGSGYKYVENLWL